MSWDAITGITVDRWVIFGLFGQALFSMRFLVQWITSEIKKRSVIPTAFWVFSLAGAATLLIYAIHRRDPVFIIGQSTGFVISLFSSCRTCRLSCFIPPPLSSKGESLLDSLSQRPKNSEWFPERSIKQAS